MPRQFHAPTSARPRTGPSASENPEKRAPAKLGWRDRLSDANNIVALIVAVLAAAGSTYALMKLFVHEPPADLTAAIQRITVQQDVTWSMYTIDVPSKPRPPSYLVLPPPDTPGMLIQIQAQLSGYKDHIYSGDVTLLNPRSQVMLTGLSSAVTACSEAVPRATTYSFIIQCWVGEPRRGQQFLVQSRILYSGLKVAAGVGYVPAHQQYLAILNTGVFVSTGGR
jgi:hypothetical protein